MQFHHLILCHKSKILYRILCFFLSLYFISFCFVWIRLVWPIDVVNGDGDVGAVGVVIDKMVLDDATDKY